METPPHVLAFVQAQASNLPLYATQGAALLNSYLSAQPRQAGLAGGGGGDSRARSGSSDLAAIALRADDDPRQQQQQQQQQPSSPPAPHPLLGAGGVSGVDVLNAARAGESRSSSGPKPVPAGPTAAPTTAGRLVDRMKGRNGTAATGNMAAIRTSSNAKRPAVGTAEPSPEQPAVEAAARAREGSFIQTRAELRRARSGQAPDVKVEPAAHPKVERPRNAADEATAESKVSSAKPVKVQGASHAEDAIADDSGEIQRAALLEERRQRRQAKAAIVEPKPAAVAESEGSMIVVDGRSSDDGDSEIDRRPRKRSRPSADAGGGAKGAGKGTRRSNAAKTRAVKGSARKTAASERESKRLGLGPLDTFKATNVVDGRLTLRRRDGARPGVFNKGVASSKVAPKKGARVRGVPDLVFSERDFLNRARPTSSKSRLKSLSPVDLRSDSSSSPSTAASSNVRPSPARRPASAQSSSPTASKRVRPVAKQQQKTTVTVATRPQPSAQSAAVSRFFRSAKADGDGDGCGVVEAVAPPRGSSPGSAGAEQGGSPTQRVYSMSWPDTNEAEAEVRGRIAGAESTDDGKHQPPFPDAHDQQQSDERHFSIGSPHLRRPTSSRAVSPAVHSAAGLTRPRSSSPHPSLDVNALLYLPPTLAFRPVAAGSDRLFDERTLAASDDAFRQTRLADFEMDVSRSFDGLPPDCDSSFPPFDGAHNDLDLPQPGDLLVDTDWHGSDPIDPYRSFESQMTNHFGVEPLTPIDMAPAALDDFPPALDTLDDPTFDAAGLPAPVDRLAALDASLERCSSFDEDDRSMTPGLGDSFCSDATSDGTAADGDADDPLDLLGHSFDDDALDLALSRHWQPHRT